MAESRKKSPAKATLATQFQASSPAAADAVPTVHADPGGPPVFCHLVIGGPGVNTSARGVLVHPGSGAPPVQLLDPRGDPGRDLLVPVPVPAVELAGQAVGFQIGILPVGGPAAYMVSLQVIQAGHVIGVAPPASGMASSSTHATLWLQFV